MLGGAIRQLQTTDVRAQAPKRPPCTSIRQELTSFIKSGKAVLALFSQEQLLSLLVLDLELGAFLLNAAGSSLDHMVNGDVP